MYIDRQTDRQGRRKITRLKQRPPTTQSCCQASSNFNLFYYTFARDENSPAFPEKHEFGQLVGNETRFTTTVDEMQSRNSELQNLRLNSFYIIL